MEHRPPVPPTVLHRRPRCAALRSAFVTSRRTAPELRPHVRSTARVDLAWFAVPPPGSAMWRRSATAPRRRAPPIKTRWTGRRAPFQMPECATGECASKDLRQNYVAKFFDMAYGTNIFPLPLATLAGEGPRGQSRPGREASFCIVSSLSLTLSHIRGRGDRKWFRPELAT